MMRRMLVAAFDAPWKLQNEFWRFLAYPAVRLIFASNGIRWGDGWRFYGVPLVQKHRRSTMRFGPGLQLRSSRRSNPLSPNHPLVLATWRAGAVLEVGSDFAMTGGVLCATERIAIGDHVAVGANSTIVDTDFHPLHVEGRRTDASAGRSAPVIIGDDVFIGMNCLVLKGVTIGTGSVIGAGSVVAQDVPPGAIVAGNPARVVRMLGRDFLASSPATREA